MQEATKDGGNDDESSSPTSVFRSCRQHYMPNFVRCASFPRAGCGKSACPVRRAGRGNSTKPNRTEVTLRESAVNYHRETKVTAPLLDSTQKCPSTNPGIAPDPPHSVEDNSHTFRKFDIDDARSLYMPSRGFGSGQDVPFAPARSRYHRTDPSRT